jgi:hypothetical protein
LPREACIVASALWASLVLEGQGGAKTTRCGGCDSLFKGVYKTQPLLPQTLDKIGEKLASQGDNRDMKLDNILPKNMTP